MAIKIVLTEKQEKILIENIICEQGNFPVEPNKVLLVKNFLDKNYRQSFLEDIKKHVVNKIDSMGNVTKTLSMEQLYDELENQFINLYSNNIQRSRFIAQVIKDWYNKKITDLGLLSINSY